MSEKKVDFTRDVIMLSCIEKAGNFKDDKGRDVDYHNFVFNFCEPIPCSPGDNVVNFSGAVPFELKIKAKEINQIFGIRDFYSAFNDDWIGDVFNISYGREGVISIVKSAPVK